LQAGQAKSSHSTNFNSLRTYIRDRQRTATSSAPQQQQATIIPSKQVTTLAVSDATSLGDIEWAVVDVETTGLSFKWCRVIDVAAVILGKSTSHRLTDGNRESSHESSLHVALQTLVNPLPPRFADVLNSNPTLPPVPKRILELTGITREVAPL
jgi:DNA polymerase III epsilon subunit-like protein